MTFGQLAILVAFLHRGRRYLKVSETLAMDSKGRPRHFPTTQEIGRSPNRPT